MSKLFFEVKNIAKKITPGFLISSYHFFFSFLGALIYGFPSRKMSVIGVTGTNGKSTVIELSSAILRRAGIKTASISSVNFRIGDKKWSNDLKMTMPGRLNLQKFLKRALREGCSHVLIETTSEGIKQHRHKFIDFKTAVLTNLAPEHIESHGSFENYKKAKGKLFKASRENSIVNLDDKNSEYFLNFSSERKYGYGIEFNEDDLNNIEKIKAEDVEVLSSGIKFKVKGVEFDLKLKGLFNVYNCLSSISIGLSQKLSLEDCKKALEGMEGIEGRVEIVLNEPFKVIVDYAHTPDALEALYKTVLKLNNGNGRIIGVLGSCGGGRDKWKRKEMGEIASSYCDEIILTNEDPYDEPPKEILKDIKKGLKNKKAYEIIDRREAIKKAFSLASKGDAVVVTGKGSEPWMCLEKGKKIPWDDREVAREEIKNIKT
jgi:UDP-N-acetylmuramoyl-L-alanyl-D-glutamate--2,6-diaminopimelate ligase